MPSVKYLTHTGTRVSNHCSFTVVVFLCRLCYPWENYCFGGRCCAVRMRFFVCWQSIVKIVFLP